ncbi:MAG: hypothetical protein WA817_24285 [Candidatus Acidiferrum sp.]
MKKLQPGDRVSILTGDYRGNPGTYKGPARGKHRGMLRIRVHGAWGTCAQTIVCLPAKSIRRALVTP